MKYEKKCLRCGVVSEAASWPGAAMNKTMCRVICKEMTTHHFREKTISFKELVAGQVKKEARRQRTEDGRRNFQPVVHRHD
jgi:hypothetical protein